MDEKEPVYGHCRACRSIEVKLNNPDGTVDYSAIGEAKNYPSGHGCELCN